MPDVTVQDHFGSDAFRTPGGIFATVWHEKKNVNLMLTPVQQRNLVDGQGFVAIDNAWGRKGATTANLELLDRARFLEALRTAWHNSAEKASRRGSKSRPARKKKPETTRKR